jgi:heme/copper-type cytochrome/quinol oxidase subunit 2
MQNDYINLQQEILQQLKANHTALSENNIKLAEINHNMLKVFWIVAIFALLYFGLMLYLLFYR